MDLILRDRLTGAVLTILPAAPTSGYLSVKLTERLWRPDAITVELDARVARDADLTKGRLLEVEGLIFLIEQIHIATDEESRVSALATVAGFDPVSVPRSLQPTSGQSHDVQSSVPGETAMKHYVDANIGSSAAAPRGWDLLAIEPDGGRGATGEWRARYPPLVDMLQLIGQETGIGYQTGWDLTLGSHGKAEFRVVAGEHRDRLLAVREGTARSEEILRSDVELRSYAYVAGQGEGAARTIVERFLADTEPAELLRRELFVDARDIDATDALESRGDQKLAETRTPDAAEVEVAEFTGWRYGEHFALGDTLTYRNDWGGGRIVRIVEAQTTWRESQPEPDRRVVLDQPFPDISDRDTVSGGTQFQ